ncbi:hypothetical protein BGZ73_005035 [Actinomortierella ambigua]|nr:hypothetical protein BGZ73_005035 [Actinomortierella ambigua]
MADDMTEISPEADEAQLLRDIYSETQGPRKGISLTFAQAQDLLRHHNLLPTPASSHENMSRLAKLLYVRRGYNNRVYLATCTDGSSYVIRLGGRFWDYRKIINEEGALHLARDALRDVVRVPRFLATSAATRRGQHSRAAATMAEVEGTKTTHNPIPIYDYVIMDRLPGVPLDTVWDTMSFEDKKVVVDQVVEIFARLQLIPLDTIGNFVESAESNYQQFPMNNTSITTATAAQSSYEVGALMEAVEGKGGPYHSWCEFVASNVRQEIQTMLRHGDKFAILQQYLPRLEELAAKIESGELEARFSSHEMHHHHSPQAADDGLSNRPIRFMHGDFESRNILVDGTRLTGLHDFEFAGAYPVEQEWCQSLEWIAARAEDPFDDATQELLRNLTLEQRSLRDYFYQAMQERHGLRPVGAPGDGSNDSDREEKMNSGYLQYKVVLYHLQANIAPWWLRDTASTALNEKETASLMNAARSLDQALKYLGF